MKKLLSLTLLVAMTSQADQTFVSSVFNKGRSALEWAGSHPYYRTAQEKVSNAAHWAKNNAVSQKVATTASDIAQRVSSHPYAVKAQEKTTAAVEYVASHPATLSVQEKIQQAITYLTPETPASKAWAAVAVGIAAKCLLSQTLDKLIKRSSLSNNTKGLYSFLSNVVLAGATLTVATQYANQQ